MTPLCFLNHGTDCDMNMDAQRRWSKLAAGRVVQYGKIKAARPAMQLVTIEKKRGAKHLGGFDGPSCGKMGSWWRKRLEWKMASCDKVKLEVGGSSDESSDNWDICFLIMLWNLLPWQGWTSKNKAPEKKAQINIEQNLAWAKVPYPGLFSCNCSEKDTTSM